MFETVTLTYNQESKRVWGTFVGVTGQALLVTCAVIAPMIWPAALPHAAWITGIEAPGPPPAPPPGPAITPRVNQAPRPFRETGLIAPTTVPARAATIIDEAPVMAGTGGVDGGVVGGDPNGVVGGILRSVMSEGSRMAAVVKPPEPAVVNRAATAPGTSVVKPPRLSALELAHPISRVDPIYPPLARQMRIAGVVELQGVLGTDGRIHELKVLRGHPMLVKAAVDAVSQWTYAPAILNGQAVEVVAPIIVTFKLN